MATPAANGHIVDSMELNRRNWANLLAYVANVAVTYGSLTGIFGETNTNLSKKYQTLVTPAGWAFSIWGPIFIWEGIFAAAQMFPQLRSAGVAQRVSSWWCCACMFQIAWSIFFAREAITLALLCMLGILMSLLGLLWRADTADSMKCTEYWLLRAPFSLHAGWILAASAVNISVQADAAKASPETLLALAIVSLGAVFAMVTLFALAVPKPDFILCLASAWALLGVSAELNSADNLLNPDRFNPVAWDKVTLFGVRVAALVLGLVSLVLSVLAAGLRVSRHGASRMHEPQTALHSESVSIALAQTPESSA